MVCENVVVELNAVADGSPNDGFIDITTNNSVFKEALEKKERRARSDQQVDLVLPSFKHLMNKFVLFELN